MDNELQSAEELFGATRDLSPERRSAFLDKACFGMPEVRRLVEEMLQRDERLKSYLPHSSGEAKGGVDSTATMGDLTGTKLGRYAIVERLGFGGMGVVYRARDEKLERFVAIKILAPGLLLGEDARRRFRREALALAKLNHAHIAAVYDVGEQDGIDYLVMECVPGESLAARLAAGPMTVKDATSITQQIAQALEEAHEQGVIHRDLKPSNVMVTPKGLVKVLDFGLAKLLDMQGTEETQSLEEGGRLMGTVPYMSPEQAYGKTLDTRTDLWSLGVVYYETLTAQRPFHADSAVGVLRAITQETPKPVTEIRVDAPSKAGEIVGHALEKNPADRYQSASEMVKDTSDLLTSMSGMTLTPLKEPKRISRRLMAVLSAVGLLLLAGLGVWLYQRASNRRWAREDAAGQIANLMDTSRSLAALGLLEKAEGYLPGDPQLKKIANEDTLLVAITSSPAGASVAIQDYSAPDSAWRALGVTPLKDVRVPKGYFRWKVGKAGSGEVVTAPETDAAMDFALDADHTAPGGMVYVPGGGWGDYIGFVGMVGPYKLPAFYVDRYEVTNREYQEFVDAGGYEKTEYWTEKFAGDGRELSRADAMAAFRDTSGRPGPSTWAGGHYPEGKGDYPVSGVSWFEAAAYAAYAKKELPAFAQWYKMAPEEVASHIVQMSNISTNEVAAAGKYGGLGPYGTYDTAGNVREWVLNPVDKDLRFILGGSWKSPSYMYDTPEAASPFDRSETNGFRCVQNLAPLAAAISGEVKRTKRDFTTFKPADDEVFHAYQLLYKYPKTALNVQEQGLVQETVDWREEKVSFDTGYRGERMAAYLFLPKNVKPPYQTVLFFPSARVELLAGNDGGRALGDMQFFDYILQSGRAVMYPIYENLYERRVKFSMPGGSQNIELTTDWYKDASRSLDYLATRQDIDNGRLAYLGVSMGSADGVILATLMQERLKTAIFLDGGYFLDPPPPGGDAADFAVRMKKPVLMVNGRYDHTFSVETAQNPLFRMLGTPEADKKHVLLETPHDVTEDRPRLTKEVLAWLDKYLGRVE